MTVKRGNRTLIAYASKGGVTREYSETIAEVLREKYGHQVDTVDIRKNRSPSLSGYDNVILGTGVRMGRVYKEGLRFLERDFGDKRVAVFLSSNEAGTPESYEDAVRKYMDPIREKHPDINLVEIEGFGGRIRVLGKTTVDLSDPEKAKSWAEQLGDKLQTPADTP